MTACPFARRWHGPPDRVVDDLRALASGALGLEAPHLWVSRSGPVSP